MRVILAAMLLLVAAPAAAQDHILVKWKKDDSCAILTKLPFFGDHWVQVGIYPTKWEAERALAASRKRGECPPSKDGDGRSTRR